MHDKKTRKGKLTASPFLFPGQATFLDHDIWPGLFEACNGNRYLITAERNNRRAIVLRHTHLPRLSFVKLKQRRLEYGSWWGPARIRLSHIANGIAATDNSGLISFDDNDMCLSCLATPDRISRVKVGFSGAICKSLCFDGWSIGAAAIGSSFLERSADGTYRADKIGFDPPFSHPAMIDVDFVL